MSALGRVVWNAEFRFALLSTVLCYFGRKARAAPAGMDTMVTFFLAMVPSETPFHLLALQIFIMWSYIPTLVEKYKRRWSDDTKDVDSQNLKISKTILLAFGLFTSVWSTLSFSKLLKENIQSVYRIRGVLQKAGIEPVAPTRSFWSFRRLLLILFPLTIFLRRRIHYEKSKTFATVPKTLQSTTNDKNLKLDLYWHEKRRMENAPVFLYIHGGGWVVGHRHYHSIPLLYQIARSGWIVATINYRLCPKVRAYPEQLMDCKLAVKWIRENIQEYGGDPSFIVCGGESAGGHLSTLLSLTANVPEYQPNFESLDTSVKGCVNLYGVMDLTDHKGLYEKRGKIVKKLIEKVVMKRERDSDLPIFKRASPFWRVQEEKSTPPIMTIHGVIDTLVPYEDGKNFHRELTKKREKEKSLMNVQNVSLSAPSELDVFLKLPVTHHAFNFVISARTLALGDAVVDFIHAIHRKEKGIALTSSKL